ncbi:MAG: mechanosensitive ion channel family protein [Patescibacteria group bacterium]|nr:mechanosensitive ion channel family protein [Patescibacteria group bacterium]
MENIKNFIENNTFLRVEFLGNSVGDWLIAVLIFLAALIVLRLFKSGAVAKLRKISQKTKTEIDDMAIDALDSIHWPFYIFISFYFSLFFITTPLFVKEWSFYIFLIAMVYYIVRFLATLTDYGVKMAIEKRSGEGDPGIIKFLGITVKIVLWVIAAVLILDNMGYQITSLVAGLGIGGIAVALALQNILGDLFSSFAIYFDKPFKIGDFIIVGEHMGTVKRVGIKTTRIQALQGEEIVISNNELTSARVQNFGVMRERRIVFTVGVAYNTSREKLEKIPSLIKEIVAGQKDTRLDRVHLKNFGDFSLVFEIVYYVNSGDYNFYMDTQQSINFGILNKFSEEKIEIAFPTQTLYLKKEKI